MTRDVHRTNRPYNVPRPSGSVRIVPAPDGCATSADKMCAQCLKPLPLNWREETFASGRVAVYPVLASGCKTTVRGLAICPSCSGIPACARREAGDTADHCDLEQEGSVRCSGTCKAVR